MDKYKGYIARTDQDRIQLEILAALEKLLDHFSKPIEVPALVKKYAESETIQKEKTSRSQKKVVNK